MEDRLFQFHEIIGVNLYSLFGKNIQYDGYLIKHRQSYRL